MCGVEEVGGKRGGDADNLSTKKKGRMAKQSTSLVSNTFCKQYSY